MVYLAKLADFFDGLSTRIDDLDDFTESPIKKLIKIYNPKRKHLTLSDFMSKMPHF
jgi:hypothetical protein